MNLLIERGVLQNLEEVLTGYTPFLIVDEKVKALFSLPLMPTFVVPSGELSKSLEMAGRIWNKMFDSGCDRQTCVIAMGGGVVTDLAGFVASCYMRGVPYVSLPTTLLAMVDASIGGKTGVNLQKGKNIVGTFYQPKSVLIDPEMLVHLPEKEFSAGLAEVIKTAFVLDPSLFCLLEEKMESIMERDPELLLMIIRRTAELKNQVVIEDERDRGRRAILNFGHTFGHALEAMMQYQGLSHGEAVAIGMCYEARLSCKLDLLSQELLDRLEALIQRAALPVSIPGVDQEELLDFMKRDKKSLSGEVVCVVAKALGQAAPMRIDDEAIICL